MLVDALAKYYAWHKDLGQVEGVWGNGSTADCTWLRSAYTAVSGELPIGCPWDFWQERDVRTVVALGWLAKLPNYKKELAVQRHAAQLRRRRSPTKPDTPPKQ